ncbi:MAG: 50S ribosomal protein L18 [Bacteroidota bacterium]|nr:50S ribosomal protein L18 [Bacteroidota bacterium]MDP4234718.1 50S ribosomal protein L18 [Bacteroidota bacterium]MDP4243941.1 50S ribosomal protein L18 [Bacteroidota bacterium]
MASKLHLQEKAKRRERRKHSIRKKIHGTAETPRLVIFRSNTGVYAQLINDAQGFTLAAASSKGLKGPKTDLAKQTGKALAEMATQKGIKTAVFDRNGYLYHGRVKALADGAREGGLAF